ncbi:MAG: hypothetical protein JWM44_1319 [Bacilli bacterium]|nr:hypothetical protein [Bacilli bacterium]
MKKTPIFLMGLVVGVLAALSSTALADGTIKNLIGLTIQGQFPVTVDGTQLTNPAIVTDGTSFLPVREFGESVGYNVYFDPEGKIILNKKTGDPMNTAQPVPNNQGKSPQEQINEAAQWDTDANKKNDIAVLQGNIGTIQGQIDVLQKSINETQRIIDDNRDFQRKDVPNFNEDAFNASHKTTIDQINSDKQKLLDLQTQLSDLQKQLSALQGN